MTTERLPTTAELEPGDCHHTITRRRLLGGAVAAGVATLAGCLGGETEHETPDAIALDGPKECDVCGMVIEETFGPNGQVFFDGEYPEGRDGPAWYDSVRELFTDRFARENRYDSLVAYVTDYSAVDYTISEVDGTAYLSGHVAEDSFTSAAEAVYVVESEVEGVMGPDLFPFSAVDDGESFVTDHGGELVDYDDVSLSLIDSL